LGRSDVSDTEVLEISDLVTNVMGCIKLTNKSFSRSDRAKAQACVKEFKKIAKSYYYSPSLKQSSLIAQLKKLGYSEEKTYGFISMFLVAGTVTVSSSFPRLLALLIDTGSFAMLQERPELIESAIDEAFRFISPGTTSLYGIKRTVTIDGREYRKGRRVVISLYNILHDSRYTSNPNIFDIQREQNSAIQGLWFGTGPHFCMGSILAKLEIKSLLLMLIKLDGNLRIEERIYRKVGVYPSYEKLFVTLHN
jgi:cytochrome P450